MSSHRACLPRRSVVVTALTIAVTCRLLASLPQDAAEHWSAGTRRVVLDNGLTILMLPRGELPIVSVQALYRVGSRNEAPGITGAAHYLEHMAFRSTEGIAKKDLTNQILRWGGRWNGYTSYDQTVYGSHTPSQYLDWLLYLERQRMSHVIFAEDEVEKERTSVIAELHNYEDSPAYVLVEHRMRRAAMVAHPYGSPIMGWISDLHGVTAPELQRFYRDYYTPGNLILAIVGHFDPEAALGLVRKHFGDAPATGRSTALRTIEPEQHGTRRVTMDGTGSSAHLEIAVHAPAAADADFATLLVLDGVLAGGKASGRASARAGSRLYRALIESGAADDVTTEIEASQYPGLYAIGVDAAAEVDMEKLERQVTAVLDEVGRQVSGEEVTRAARQIRASTVFSAESNRAIANLLTVYEELGSYKLLETIPARVAQVTAAQVRELARTRLAAPRRTIGTFVPEASGPSSMSGEMNSAPQRPAGTPGATDQKEPEETKRQGTEPKGPERPPGGTRESRPAPPAPELSTPVLPRPFMRTLENGLTVSVLPMPGETVHARIRIEAGSVNDPAGVEGTALLTARLLSAGTQGRPGRAITTVFTDRSVRLVQTAADIDDPFANRHFVEISGTCLKEYAGEVVPLLADLVMKPSFPLDAVARAKAGIAGELRSLDDDSDWRAARALVDRLFPAPHPYARKVEGTTASLAAITRSGLQAFHARYFQPGRVVVSIAGATTVDAALEMVQQSFGTWKIDRPGSEAAVAPPPSAIGRGGPVHVSMPHKAQASIAVGLPGVRRDNPDYVALSALNYLLGETGYAGRLGETLVDTGIAYSVYTTVNADRAAGPILINTNAVRSTEAVTRIVDTLAGFAGGEVSEAELREAQGFLLGRLLFRFESPAAATATLADAAYFGKDGALDAFAARVKALTVADLNRVAKEYYDPARAVIAVAGR